MYKILSVVFFLQSSYLFSISTTCEALRDSNEVDKVVVVGFDTKTLRPEPFGLGVDHLSYRAKNAVLINKLNDANVKGIAFDFYYRSYKSRIVETKEFAQAAQMSAAPVVIAVNATMNSRFKFNVSPTASSLRSKNKIYKGSINFISQETELISKDKKTSKVITEPLMAFESVNGYYNLAEELAIRTNVITRNQMYSLGLVETYSFKDNDKTVNLPVIYPDIISSPVNSICTLSYIDVYNGMHKEILDNALVLVGMLDNKRDLHLNPDKNVDKIHGIYLHSAILQRIIKANKKKTELIADVNAATNVKRRRTVFVPTPNVGSKTYKIEHLLSTAIYEAKKTKIQLYKINCEIDQPSSECVSNSKSLNNHLKIMVRKLSELEEEFLYLDDAYDNEVPDDVRSYLLNRFVEFKDLLILKDQIEVIFFPKSITNELNEVYASYFENAEALLSAASFVLL